MSIVLNLRQAIYQKLRTQSEDELSDVIQDAIGNDERTLPGLGVIFEIMWQNIDKDTRALLVHTLKEHIPQS